MPAPPNTPDATTLSSCPGLTASHDAHFNTALAFDTKHAAHFQPPAWLISRDANPASFGARPTASGLLSSPSPHSSCDDSSSPNSQSMYHAKNACLSNRPAVQIANSFGLWSSTAWCRPLPSAPRSGSLPPTPWRRCRPS
ncbi:unnamed protein product [Ectocarpus sp. CCAP 1310/34]|nr:unnamed protein product [Ectocarpus sp. CCAP 1310/34]